MSNLKQMNVHIEPDYIDEIERLADRHFASKADAIRAAIRTLTGVMSAHEAFSAQHDADIAELYMRLAGEAPAGFVEVPKDGVRAGRIGDQPAVQLGNWVVTDFDGDLMAEELDGERRLGKVVDGEIKPLKLPREEVALN
jgi:Arc/MetJ-type ribon-helix-helix transcriptional regulator